MERLVLRVSIVLLLALSALSPGIALAQNYPFSNLDGTFEMDRTRQPVTAWCVHDQFQPLMKPEFGSEEVPEKSLKFLEALAVAKTVDVDNRKWRLLGRLNNQRTRISEYLGWVPSDKLVTENECLKTEFGIYRKAMLINPEYLDDENKKRLSLGENGAVNLRLAPLENAAIATRSYPWFTFFFVYGEVQGQLLLGTSPTFRSSEINRIILGWVPRDSLCLWNTREAFHWDRESTAPSSNPRRTVPAAAYRTASQAYHVLGRSKGKSGTVSFPHPEEKLMEIEYVVSETFDTNGVSIPLAPIEPRFPNLEYNGDNTLFGKTDPGTGMTLLKIGCIGGLGKFTSADLAKYQDQLKQIKKEFGSVEILFVIDDTLSMVKWFDIVSKCVIDIRDEVVAEAAKSSSGERASVRLAVSYYNNYKASGPQKGQHSPEVNVLQDARINGQRIAEQLRNHKSPTDLVPSTRELIFDGLEKAILAANFTQSSRKIVVLLGDFGDLELPNSVDAYRKVANELFQANSAFNIEFYPIQVTNLKGPDYESFASQMSGIVEQINVQANDFLTKNVKGKDKTVKEVRIAEFIPAEKDINAMSKKVSSFILEQFRLKRLEAESKEEEIARLIRGDWNTKLNPQTYAQLRKRNFPVDDLAKNKGTQMFREGYVWQESGQRDATRNWVPQVRLWVLMNEAEVILLRDTLEGILDESRGSPEALAEAIGTQIQAIAGDLDSSEDNREVSSKSSLSHALGKKIPGLESHLRSKFMTLTKDSDFSKIDSTLLTSIKEKAFLLDDIVQRRKVKRRPKPLVAGQKIPDYVEIDSKPFDRRYSIPDSDAVWFWIDVKEELP